MCASVAPGPLEVTLATANSLHAGCSLSGTHSSGCELILASVIDLWSLPFSSSRHILPDHMPALCQPSSGHLSPCAGLCCHQFAAIRLAARDNRYMDAHLISTNIRYIYRSARVDAYSHHSHTEIAFLNSKNQTNHASNGSIICLQVRRGRCWDIDAQ